MSGRPSVEEIRRFLREKYGPEWEDKIELGYKLWEKQNAKKRYVGNTSRAFSGNPEYVEKNIAELKDREFAEVMGIVLERDFFKYYGCPVCYKSMKNGCEHLNGGNIDPVELKVSKVVVSDGSGEVTASLIVTPDKEDPFEDVDEGDVVKVRGYVRVMVDEVRIYVNDAELVKSVGLDDEESKEKVGSSDKQGTGNNIRSIDDLPENVRGFLRYLSNVGGVAENIANIMMERKGITWDDIKDFVEVKDGYFVVKEGVF